MTKSSCVFLTHDHLLVPMSLVRDPRFAIGPLRLLLWLATEPGMINRRKAASDLDVSRPSILRWLRQLAETPYLTITDRGERDLRGNRIYRYHVDLRGTQ